MKLVIRIIFVFESFHHVVWRKYNIYYNIAYSKHDKNILTARLSYHKNDPES